MTTCVVSCPVSLQRDCGALSRGCRASGSTAVPAMSSRGTERENEPAIRSTRSRRCGGMVGTDRRRARVVASRGAVKQVRLQSLDRVMAERLDRSYDRLHGPWAAVVVWVVAVALGVRTCREMSHAN